MAKTSPSMPGLAVPQEGLRLSALPKPIESYKRERTTQAVEIRLPDSTSIGQLQDLGEGKIHVRLGGPNPQIDVNGNKLPLDVRLHDNGYLYRFQEDAVTLALKARLDLRKPETETGTDSGMLKLMQGLANAKAEKRTAPPTETGLTDTIRGSKRRKIDPTAHRRGLFGGQQGSRSATGSPNLPPSKGLLGLPTISVTPGDPIKKAKQEAIRVALIHLVAVRDVSKDYIVKTLRCTAHDVEPLLSRHCASSLAPNKYQLNPKAFKLLDPYGFNYPDEDRQSVIDKAITAFDRMRLGPEEKEWQKLLPKEERGKGHCLSKLEKQKEIVLQEEEAKKAAAQEKATQPKDTPAVKSPSIATRPGSAGSGVSRPGSRGHDTSRKDWASLNDKPKQTKAGAEDLTQVKPQSSQKSAPAPALAKAVVKKAAEKKAPKKVAKVSSTQLPTGKIKSAEFITESDEEEIEAAIRLDGVSPRPALSPAPRGSKEPAKVNESRVNRAPAKQAAAPATIDKAASKTIRPSLERPGQVLSKQPTVAKASNQAVSTARSSATRPPALDKAKFASQPTRTPPASRPITPTSASMPLSAKPSKLQAKKVLVHASGPAKPPLAGAPKAAAPKPATSVPRDSNKVPAAVRPDTLVAKASTPRDVSQKPVVKRNPDAPPKRDPDAPPKRYDAETKPEVAKKMMIGTTKSKAAAGKPGNVIPVGKTVKARNPAAESKTAGSGTSAKASGSKTSEVLKAPAMQKTGSRQRKSSSPIKPSPLASSPPISASDMDEQRGSAKPSAANTPLKRAASGVLQRPAVKVQRREAPTSQPAPKPTGENERVVKRKANDVDSSSTKQGSTLAGTFERPAKRRDTGVPAPRSAGASGSKASKHVEKTLKAKPDNVDRTDSHSPSPASSTIGSTSTKGTSASLLSTAGCANKDLGKDKQVAKAVGSDSERFKGFARADLERASSFEKEMEAYNKLQREVALMGDKAPVEKVRELHKRFNNLELQKRVLASIANSV